MDNDIFSFHHAEKGKHDVYGMGDLKILMQKRLSSEHF